MIRRITLVLLSVIFSVYASGASVNSAPTQAAAMPSTPSSCSCGKTIDELRSEIKKLRERVAALEKSSKPRLQLIPNTQAGTKPER